MAAGDAASSSARRNASDTLAAHSVRQADRVPVEQHQRGDQTSAGSKRHAVAARLNHPVAHERLDAIAGIALSFVALVVATAAMAWADVTSSWLVAAATLIYVTATYAALSVLYLDIVNIAETSLHMHLLLEVAWNDRLSLATLIDKYSPAHMVGERIDRLTALGQIRAEGDRYYLGGNRSALMISACVDAWRTVLGMPTSPDKA